MPETLKRIEAIPPNTFDDIVNQYVQINVSHPFLDGNGRIGRLLIILFLIEKGLLKTPVLYISYFLKKNRIEYYDRLSEVRNKGNYEQWIKFFLQAIMESAEDAIITIDRLAALHNKNVGIINSMGRASKNTLRLLGYIEANPIIEISQTAEALDLAFNTTSDAIKRLEKAGILAQSAGQQRNRIYSYKEYLNFLRDGT